VPDGPEDAFAPALTASGSGCAASVVVVLRMSLTWL
jgi:hypothetical protein